MKSDENLCLDVRPVPVIERATANWFAARDKFKIEPSNENQNEYNATYFALGAAWAERHPDSANLPGAFESFRRGLVSPETDE